MIFPTPTHQNIFKKVSKNFFYENVDLLNTSEGSRYRDEIYEVWLPGPELVVFKALHPGW
jgi:hypothetical protein